jgi:4-carboxymuconolactone decarboxylase
MKPRLPAFVAEQASTAQRAVLQDILNGPRGNLNGPFLAWIRSPQLADTAQQLGAFCRYQTGLPLRLSELAILVTAAQWRSQAEWYIHAPIALQAGVPAAVLEAIRQGGEPHCEEADDALVYRFARELHATRRVSDAVYAQAIERFGLEVVVNLVALLGYYSLVAMTLNVFDMRAEGQTQLPFAQ